MTAVGFTEKNTFPVAFTKLFILLTDLAVDESPHLMIETPAFIYTFNGRFHIRYYKALLSVKSNNSNLDKISHAHTPQCEFCLVVVALSPGSWTLSHSKHARRGPSGTALRADGKHRMHFKQGNVADHFCRTCSMYMKDLTFSLVGSNKSSAHNYLMVCQE